MTWAKLGDETASTPEWVGIVDAAMRRSSTTRDGSDPIDPLELLERSRHAAAFAKLVHQVALMWSVPALTDGVITYAGVQQISSISSLTEHEVLEAIELLVVSGAWRIQPVDDVHPFGGWRMVLGWKLDEQPTRLETERRIRVDRLRRRLRPDGRDYSIRLLVARRANGRCEYCDEPGAEQMDHIDPDLEENTPDNLALSCERCNKRKGRRTPAEAGLPLTARARRNRTRWANRNDPT